MKNLHLCLDGDLPSKEVNDWALSRDRLLKEAIKNGFVYRIRQKKIHSQKFSSPAQWEPEERAALTFSLNSTSTTTSFYPGWISCACVYLSNIEDVKKNVERMFQIKSKFIWNRWKSLWLTLSLTHILIMSTENLTAKYTKRCFI